MGCGGKPGRPLYLGRSGLFTDNHKGWHKGNDWCRIGDETTKCDECKGCSDCKPDDFIHAVLAKIAARAKEASK